MKNKLNIFCNNKINNFLIKLLSNYELTFLKLDEINYKEQSSKVNIIIINNNRGSDTARRTDGNRLLQGITQPPRTAFILDYVRPIAPPGPASEHSAPPYVQAHWGGDNNRTVVGSIIHNPGSNPGTIPFTITVLNFFLLFKKKFTI